MAIMSMGIAAWPTHSRPHAQGNCVPQVPAPLGPGLATTGRPRQRGRPDTLPQYAIPEGLHRTAH
jgi:hypothetical protein